MRFKEFDKTYRCMIEQWNARMFYENVSSLEHCYRKIKNIKSKTAKEFYDSLIVNDKNKYLIFESHEDAQFSKALTNKIFNANDFTQIQASEVFNRCSNYIKSNYEIKRDIPIYIFNFSFSNNAKMICSIFSSFKITFSKEDGSLKEKYEYEEKIFKNNYEHCYGLCTDQGTCVFILFNKDKINETSITHELNHYLQLILEKDNDEKKLVSKFQNIEALQLNEDEQSYLFDKWEFSTHIKVNLVNFLDELYWKFYHKQNWTRKKFIDKFIEVVEREPLRVILNFMQKILHMKNQDTTALRLFAACFIVDDKQYLIDAIKWLKEAFK